MSEAGPKDYDKQQMNQRGTLRAPLIVEKIPCGDGRKTLFGYAKNLSRGGLFIATVKPREPGEEFTIELNLPTPDRFTLRCQCQVVWKRLFQRNSPFEPGMGLRFLDLPDAAAEKIEAWVNAQATAPSE